MKNNINYTDVVVLWVDGSDPEWQKEKAKYSGKATASSASACRFREWGVFKYWFRAVEENMPWVRTVHLVTNGQVPDFLDVSNKRLHLVKHSDIMPADCLPTFASTAIEINIHRIEGLADQFIYFNDDMYVMQPLQEREFFYKGLPRYEGLEALFRNASPCDGYWHRVLNDSALINRHFRKYDVLRRHFSKFYNYRYGIDNFRNIALLPWPAFQFFTNRHLPMPFLKESFQEVWAVEPEVCRQTTAHRFKTFQDINQYVFRYWAIASGKFHPIHTDGKAYHLESADINEVINEIVHGKGKMLCVNDGMNIEDLEEKQRRITEAFETRFPKKSSFEK